MSDRGAVFDLGYTPHDGPRLGRRAAVAATVKDGLRRVFGIRRKARKKVLPILLFVIAMMPAIVSVGFVFLTSQLPVDALDSPLGSHYEYFSFTASIVLLFAALASPELLIPDRVDGVMSVYASRPMTVTGYLTARAAALGGVMAAFMLLPQLLLYIGFAALDPGGLASNLVGNIGDLGRVLVTIVAFIVGYGAPALLVATFAKRLAPASGIYLGLMIALSLVGEGLSSNGPSAVALLTLLDHPLVIRDWVFGESSDTAPALVGLSPWLSLLVIAVLGITTYLVARSRYRRLM